MPVRTLTVPDADEQQKLVYNRRVREGNTVELPADQMIRNILGYRRRFAGLVRQIDDTSIVVIKCERT